MGAGGRGGGGGGYRQRAVCECRQQGQQDGFYLSGFFLKRSH